MKLRNLGILLLLALVLLGCASASRSFSRGHFDDAINRSITILQREPSNELHLDILRDAYRVADANDRERILALQETGQPDIWGDVVTIYERMIARNRRINALPSSVISEIGFVFESHSQELAHARQRATEYHYAAGIQFLESGTRMAAREAFGHFEQVVALSGPDFRDVRRLRDRAQELGTIFVLFQAINRTPGFLPPEAVWHLTNIYPQHLNRRWIQYETEPRRSHYHFEVTFALERRIIFPITVNTRRFTETRTITEGTEFKLDNRGNPVLDSAGNAIRIPKRITLRCTVTEITQTKRVRLEGRLTYFDVENQRIVRSIALSRTFSAESVSFNTSGDLRALSDETRRRIRAPFIPLPTDEQMLIVAAQDLSAMVRQALLDNSRLIR
ncbi:MAG: hypothetical protein FWD02_01770 [Bacteroidales bacterium]|nr:hypothetical protein [Bacteroidales bacterium]